MTKQGFEEILASQTAAFASSLANIIAKLTGVHQIETKLGQLSKTLSVRADLITSIPFVGLVTGEFMIATSYADARTLFTQYQTEDELQEGITECLNMAAGSRIGELTALFQKLTITTPKIVCGEVRYRNIKNIPLVIQTEKGKIEAYFYIDLMDLDVANSYRSIFTGLKQANEKLTTANKRLIEQQAQLVHSEKMASLGMIAAGVAHEINNPLAFVVSNSNVLETYITTMRTLLESYEHGSLQKIQEIKQEEDVQFILEDSTKLLGDSKFGLERIRAIVNGLKRFSRVDDSGLKSVQLNEEIQNSLMLLQNELKYRCTVQTDLRAAREVECFPSEISQVLVNLFVNAAQAMKATGGILKVSTEDSVDSIIIRVKDNGMGISSENISKIFSPFFTTKSAGEGTGLGLAISHGIIHKHGGKLSVMSTIGVGTEFTIELPYQIKQNQQAPIDLATGHVA